MPPRLYGLPKIHKTGVPLRPIVSAIGSPTYLVAKFLASLLRPHVGQTESYIKDSAHFIQKIGDLHLEPEDLLISFDVISLFTKVPVQESLQYISQLFRQDITEIFRACLTTSYFLWDQEFYEQTDGVAMGSPLSPMVANFFMERFEQAVLETASRKPKVWYRYVDDTFVVWNHGEEELEIFLQHLNSQNENIQFTMEKEHDGELSFLDVLVIREGSRLGHKVYRKPTHTDRYLHKNSNHHPCQKRGVIKSLTERARRNCEHKYIDEELKHLQEAFLANGYTKKEITRALKPSNKPDNKSAKTSTQTAFLQYIPNITDRIGKLLGKYDIKTVYKPTRKVQNTLRSAKDYRDPKTSGGVYRIPCSCGQVYIGTTKRSTNTRLQEHKRCCRLQQRDKSSVAEHALENPNHQLLFEHTQLLSKTQPYFVRLNREAIEIHKHRNCFNKKEERQKVKKSWFPALSKCKIKPYQNKNVIGQLESRSPYANQSQSSTDAVQSQSSYTRSDGYITGSLTTRTVRQVTTAAETTPEDVIHSR